MTNSNNAAENALSNRVSERASGYNEREHHDEILNEMPNKVFHHLKVTRCERMVKLCDGDILGE